MIRAATAQTDFGCGTARAVMRSFSTRLASRTLTTRGTAVTKALAFVAAERVWDENSDIFAEPAYVKFFGERGRVECQNEQTGVPALPISESGESADVSYPITPQVRQDLIFGHVAQFRSENGALARVSSVVEGDGDFFATESVDVQ